MLTNIFRRAPCLLPSTLRLAGSTIPGGSILRPFCSQGPLYTQNASKDLKYNLLKSLDSQTKERELYSLHYSFPSNLDIYVALLSFLNETKKYDSVTILHKSNPQFYYSSADAKKQVNIATRHAEYHQYYSASRRQKFQNRTKNILNMIIIYYLLKILFGFTWDLSDYKFTFSVKNEDENPTDEEPAKKSTDSDSHSDISGSGDGIGDGSGGFTNFIMQNYTQTVEPEKNISTRFDEVLGIDEFKDELLDIVDFLKHPKKYELAGAKIPKGLLLSGPPGTGKTLMARALAGEAQCAFFYKSASEFNEIFVGMGALRIRKLFEAARKHEPAIIFIDEIDSIAGRRHPMEPPEKRETLNQILSEMDGFKQSNKIIVIGATNIEESLDPAIMRPGRFDKTVRVPYPNQKGRAEI
jgi:ATP-dependent metalloprotease